MSWLGSLQGAWPSNSVSSSADATGSSGLRVLPQGYGWSLLYGSLLLGLVGGVCTLGAGLYARASFLTFLLVSGSLASVLVSFVAVGPRVIQLTPQPGPNGSSLPPQVGHFTGFNSSTLKANLGGELGSWVLGQAWVGAGPLESLHENRCHRELGAEDWTSEQSSVNKIFLVCVGCRVFGPAGRKS